jgi:hypothetical protein
MEEKKMIKNSRKTALILGVLFLLVMVSWTVGYAISAQIINTENNLLNIFPNRSVMFLGAIFELINIAAIIGIVVVMYPLMKKISERMSIWYASFRIIESVLLTISILCLLAIITLSEKFINAGSTQPDYYNLLGELFITVRDNWVHLILPFFYSSAAFVFYYFFYKTKLIPRFISIIGIIASVLLLIGIPMDFFNFEPGTYVGVVGGLNELLLSAWLIIKGFNKEALAQYKLI